MRITAAVLIVTLSSVADAARPPGTPAPRHAVENSGINWTATTESSISQIPWNQIRGARSGAEQLTVRTAQEEQPDRRVEEDEEVVLDEAEGSHLAGVVREQRNPQKNRDRAHRPRGGCPEEDHR